MSDKPEKEPCEHCGQVHEEALTSELDGEELVKSLLNVVADYAMRRNIPATPANLYVMGNALARIGAQLSYEAGQMQAKLEPLLRIMSILKEAQAGAGKISEEEKLKKQMEKWPQA